MGRNLLVYRLGKWWKSHRGWAVSFLVPLACFWRFWLCLAFGFCFAFFALLALGGRSGFLSWCASLVFGGLLALLALGVCFALRPVLRPCWVVSFLVLLDELGWLSLRLGGFPRPFNLSRPSLLCFGRWVV